MHINSKRLQNQDTVNQIIPICFALDAGYIMPTAVAVHSILSHCRPENRIHFHFLVPSDFPKDQDAALRCFENNPSVFRSDIIRVKETMFQGKTHIAHITYPTFFRLVMDEYVHYSRCLYLDGDILVFRDLLELFEFPVGNCLIAGVKAPYSQLKKKNRDSHRRLLGLDSFSLYVNAGVLLFNLEGIRNCSMQKEFIRLLPKNYPIQDQDILNSACYPRIRILPPKYNVLSEFHDYPLRLLKKIYTPGAIHEARNSPVIYHFASAFKPWKFYGGRYEQEWQTEYNQFWHEKLQKRNETAMRIEICLELIKKKCLDFKLLKS